MKQKIWSRTVSFVLAALLAVTSVPVQALAETEIKANDEAVDWENIIDDCEIEVLEGGTNEQDGKSIEDLRDGNPGTVWVRNGYAGGNTSLLKFTFPTARSLKKVDMYFEKDTPDSGAETTVILLDADQQEIAGTRQTVTRQEGYEWNFADETVLQEFYVKFEESPWALIGEMQIYAARDEGENIIQDCEIEVLEGGTNEQDGKSIENLRDGDPGTVWVRNGYAGGDTSLLKFTFPTARSLKKVDMYFEKGTPDENAETTVILLDADQQEIAGTRQTVKRKEGYEWNFAGGTVLQEFYVRFEASPWALIGEMQIYAGRDAAEMENIAKDCTPSTKVGAQTNYDTVTEDATYGNYLKNINDGNPATNWMTGGSNWPASVRFQIPEGKNIKKATVKFVVDQSHLDRKVDLKLEYSRRGSAFLKLISEKTQHVLSSGNGSYEVEFTSSKNDIEYLYITISNPDSSEAGGFWSGLAEVEIYAENTIAKVERIEINAAGNAKSLTVQDTLQLTASVFPEEADNKDVIWSSSDEAVAKVDQKGLVTGVAKGNVTITAEAADGSGIKGTYGLTVNGIPITGITLNPASVTMNIGESQKIEATVVPENASDQSVTWESSNPGTAEVDEDGTVTAVGAGTAVITAAGRTETDVKQTASVTVKKPDVLAERVIVSSEDGRNELAVSEKLVLTAKVEPEGAVQAVSWRSENPEIAEVDQSGVVKALKEGEVTITAEAADKSGISGKFRLTVIKGSNIKIDLSKCELSAKNANGHGIALAVDGKADTYWQSIPSGGEGSDSMKNRMYDHNRYIDIKLDGTYDLTEIKIFNKTDGSFQNYYVYASADGKNYDKIISKTSDKAASAEGESYEVNKRAAYLRLNMAYNSNAFVTNLAEIEVKGTKISDTVPVPDPISVENWQGSKWQVEWDKFEANENGYADQKVLSEMSNLVGRVLGSKWKDSFRFELRSSLEEGKDIFEIKDGEDNTIVIRGNSGVAMASGFNYYLKNYVNIDYSPMYSSNVNLKEIKPVGKKVVKEAQFDLRYALNFCTYSYTMSFWNWDEYEEFLDWAAMNGINLILDIVGQEEVLRQTFAEFGYTDEEIKDYISGPAYFAWFYMQNLYSIGGPLPDSWFEGRVELGRQIHDRMQTYGIDPVIQAFAGQVPDTFAEKNSGAVFTPECEWSGFTRPSILKTFLDDDDKAAGKVDYFQQVADVFYAKQKNIYGNVSHYYAADPFHEGGKTSEDTGDDTDGSKRNEELSKIYAAVQKKMLEKDPEAIWVMQQWQTNLNSVRMSKLDTTKTLPLDLQANMRQENSYFEENGSRWIYCMLHNFGGRMGLDGDIPKMSSDPIETFQRSKNMVGIGMSPEALENSPVVYEMLFETTWSKDPIDYQAWIKKYGERRAGGTSDSLNKAWRILLNTAYAAKDSYYQGAAETVINARPGDGFNSASTWGHSGIYYDKEELDKALLLLIENYEEFAASPAYKYDLADVAEQVLCNAAVEYHKLMVQAKNAKDLEAFTKLSTAFLGLIDLSDQILATTDGFLLGTWIEASRKMITDADDWTKDLFEFNARSLVTTWGGERVGSLKDYSNRKWAGLTDSFYKERWEIWIRNRMAELKGEAKNAADQKAESNWFLWEYQWVNRKSDDENGKYAFAAVPTDADLGALAQQAFDDYSCTNLEKNTGQTTQETVNVAEGKPVSIGGSQTADGNAANLTDGNTATGWKAQGAGPHTITIDLEEMCQISGMVISIEQIAKGFPYIWEAEYFDSERQQWVSLDTNKNDEKPMMISTTEITKSFAASQIRLTVTTSDLTNSPVFVTEIAVNGVKEDKEQDELKNLVLGHVPTVTDKDGNTVDGLKARITDGDASTLWAPASWDNSRYPVNVGLDLQQDSYVEYVDVQFESAGRPFAFNVSVTDASGAEKKVSSEYESVTSALEKQSYRIEVKETVQKVTVSLVTNTGAGLYPGSWPALAEIKVMGTPIVSEQDFSGSPVSGITVSGGGATSKVLKDNKQKDTNDASAYDKLTLDEEVVFDLGRTHYLSHVNLVFEKIGLALKYEVYAEDASGKRELLEQYDSPANQLLADRTVRVPVGRETRKIIFIHHGNGTPEESPTAYAAEPRFYGFEAYGVAKSEVTAEQAEGLTGKEGQYQAAADTPVTITLDRPAEVNMIRVSRGDGETKTLRYLAEYYDTEKEAWEPFADKTKGQDAEESESFAVAQERVFTGRLRLTFAEDILIKDISVYNTDLLLGQILQIENILADLKYDGTHGSYKTEEKEKLESILAEAREVSGENVSVINAWRDKLSAALEEFYENGKTYIDRSGLLEVMVSVRELMETFEPTGQDLEDLQQIYEALRSVYDTYDTSQTAVSQTASEKREQIFALGTKIETVKNPELAEKRAELTEYLKELEELEPGEYAQEDWQAYLEAVEAANAIAMDWSTTSEAILAVKSQLAAAAEKLKKHVLIKTITIHAESEKTTLQAGETVQLTADIEPLDADETALEWSSDNTDTATVDQNGLVTALKEGDVRITAAAQDGSGVSGEIRLTVIKKADGGDPEGPENPEDPEDPVLVQEITVRAAGGKTTLNESGTVQLLASAMPENAENKAVAWSSDNSETAGVSESGLVTAKAAGTVRITATAKDGSGKSGSITIKILPKEGKTHKDKKLVYQITASTESVKTVTVQKPVKAGDKKITIPSSVTISGYQYQVTAIAAKAFQRNTKLTQVVIGENIKTIGKKAFYNCKKLKTITIKSKELTSIGKQAFGKIVKNAKITVPKAQYKAYKKLLQKKAKTAKSVKIRKAKK